MKATLKFTAIIAMLLVTSISTAKGYSAVTNEGNDFGTFIDFLKPLEINETSSLFKATIGKTTVVKNEDPFFKKTRNRVILNLLNLERAAVTIKVTDDKGRVVFSEVVTEKMIVEKAFNFEGAYAGNYTVTVSDTNGTYQERLIVE